MERNEMIYKRIGQCMTRECKCSYLSGKVLCRRFAIQLEAPVKSLYCCNHTYGYTYDGRP